MRFDPASAQGSSKGKSWYIEGKAAAGVPISCSFVEFDERGDFLDFRQHLHCEARLKDLVERSKILLIIYCHGWKNSSQSGDVVAFNSFLSRFAASEEIQKSGLRVHGVYLGWRGNAFRPYLDKSVKNLAYQQTLQEFGEPIVDAAYHRSNSQLGFIPENLSYWNRKLAAEHRASGLPIARAIFTYAAAAKAYGSQTGSVVCVMGHSFGALMLERSLGQATTGAVTMGWWQDEGGNPPKPKLGLPFDFVFFVNSAAPALYAKEMRDFLQANRSALQRAQNPAADVPVIVSLTSTADSATGALHPLGNLFARFAPSLQRRYTTGIFGSKQPDGSYPSHQGIRQSDFYSTTPGHNDYLINHWIVKESASVLPADTSPASVFRDNLSIAVKDPDVFITSRAKYPAAAWRLTGTPQGKPITLGDLHPSMRTSNYWIVTCDKELIGGHNDIWSPTAMEMYAGLFRAVASRRPHEPTQNNLEVDRVEAQ